LAEYHRVYQKGGMYFFTLVTFQRRPIFNDAAAIKLLENTIRSVQVKYPFEIVAFVILLDHLHYVWTLPEDESNFSIRWKYIKSSFTKEYLKGRRIDVSESMRKKGEKGVWQRRFWEHLIRDQDDLNLHLDYIHYNPVKHGLVCSPGEWEYSSFSSFVKGGYYTEDWGGDVKKDVLLMDFE